MLVVPSAKEATTLTYLTLRKAVGGIAVLLPFALAIPWWLLRDHRLQPSISDYYYTGMRNLFVGSLCAIAMFLLCCRGFDRKDQRAGMFSALCALGVAFFPTTPGEPSAFQSKVGDAHYGFAALLFLTLAYFCLVLFRMSAANRIVTRQKLQRNTVYSVSGWVILGSILAIATTKIFRLEYSILGLGPVFFFESTSLMAFGAAWLTKGETFLKDEVPQVSEEMPPQSLQTEPQ
jgi:hypothetical protein